jgi:hypothetical protein
MRRGRLNAEAPLGLLGETHPIGTSEPVLSCLSSWRYLLAQAPDPSPAVHTARPVAPSLYKNDSGQQQQFLDFDLDLNPDL